MLNIAFNAENIRHHWGIELQLAERTLSLRCVRMSAGYTALHACSLHQLLYFLFSQIFTATIAVFFKQTGKCCFAMF
jgi:hypothetical protein